MENQPSMPVEPPMEAGPPAPLRRQTPLLRRPRVIWLSVLLLILLLGGSLLGLGLAGKGPLAHLAYLGYKQFSNASFRLMYPNDWIPKSYSSSDRIEEEFTGPQMQAVFAGDYGPLAPGAPTDPVNMGIGNCSGFAFEEIRPVSLTFLTIGGQPWTQADCGQVGKNHLVVDWVIYKGDFYALALYALEERLASDQSQFSLMEQSFQFLK